MNTEALIRIQLELECIRINQRGYLESFPCDNPDNLARLYVMHDGQHYYRYLRHDVPPDLRQLLKLMAGDTLFAAHDRVQGVLLEDALCHEIFAGKTYIFPDDTPPTTDDPAVIYRDEGHLCGFVLDGEIVASCSSVRENDYAAEAWVQTAVSHRRKGYGRRVVLAWAQRIRALNKVPFYSHAVTNLPSQHLAQSVGMQWAFDIVAYS